MLLSHHGSNDRGELTCFDLALRRIGSAHSILTIVSSDPNGYNYLPWHTIGYLKCSDGVDYCTPHDITVRGSFLRMEKNKASYEVHTVNVTQPVFVTCNSQSGYYKVIISERREILLQDGDRWPLFFSNILGDIVQRDLADFKFIDTLFQSPLERDIVWTMFDKLAYLYFNDMFPNAREVLAMLLKIRLRSGVYHSTRYVKRFWHEERTTEGWLSYLRSIGLCNH